MLRTNVAESSVREPMLEVGVEPYMLVALDQRRKEGIPGSWQRCLTILEAIANRSAVKLLVAGHNAAYFMTLLEQSRHRLGEPADRVEFALCDSVAEVRLYVEGASVVLTELPNIAHAAEKAGVPVIDLHDGAVVAPPHGGTPHDVPVRREVANEPSVNTGASSAHSSLSDAPARPRGNGEERARRP